MAKSLLRNSYGHIVNLDQARAFYPKEKKGIKSWSVSIGVGAPDEFSELNQPFEYAFITKWVADKLALEQPRNALG